MKLANILQFIKSKWNTAKTCHLSYKAVLITEVIILAFVLVFTCMDNHSITFNAKDLTSPKQDIHMVDDNGTEAMYVDGIPAKTKVLETPKFALFPGAYRVNVSYTSIDLYTERLNVDNGVGDLSLVTKNYDNFALFTALRLRDAYNEVSQTLQITSPLPIEELSFEIKTNSTGELYVYSIEIQEIMAHRLVFLLMIIGGMLLFNWVFKRLFLDTTYQYKKELGFIILICICLIFPLLNIKIFDADDTDFHLNRIISLAEELSFGNFFPLNYTQALNGYSYITPTFYPQLFLYPSAIFYAVGFSAHFAYNLYIFLAGVGACLSAYYCGLKIYKDSSAAVLLSALYTFTSYRITNTLTRGAFGEIAAQVFLPLILLGFYYIFVEADSNKKIPFSKLLPLIFGLTGVAYSHLLSLEMCAMVIITVCLICIKKVFKPHIFAALAKSAGVSLILSLGFLVPLFAGMGMNLNIQNVENHIQTKGMILLNVLDFTSYKTRTAIGLPILIALVAFGIWAANRHKSTIKIERPTLIAHSIFFVFTLLAIFLSTNLFPYNILQLLPEDIYKYLVIYQFPWRWLIFGSLFGVFLAVGTVQFMKCTKLFKSSTLVVLLVCAMVLNVGQYYHDRSIDGKKIQVANNKYAYSEAVGDGSEYLIAETEVKELKRRAPLYDEEVLTVDKYTFENGITQLTVENYTEYSTHIDLPLNNYDGFVAFTKKGELKTENGANNRLRVIIPANFKGKIVVKFVKQPLHVAAGWLSLVSLILILTYLILAKYKPQLLKFKKA